MSLHSADDLLISQIKVIGDLGAEKLSSTVISILLIFNFPFSLVQNILLHLLIRIIIIVVGLFRIVFWMLLFKVINHVVVATMLVIA